MSFPRFALKAVVAVLAWNAASAAFAADTACAVNCFEKRWVYFNGDYTNSATLNNLIDVIGRAKALGYNGIALNTSGNSSYAAMLNPWQDARYYPSFQAVVNAAKANQIELIPVGGGMEVPAYSKPELIEALPAVDTPFLVHDGKATAVGASLLSAESRSFEKLDTSWGLDPSVTYDNTQANSGSSSIKFTQSPTGGAARLMRAFTGLRPHTAYRMTFAVKAVDYDTRFRIMITDTGGMPVYQNAQADLGVTSVGNGWSNANSLPLGLNSWVTYSLDFNTGNEKAVSLYIGSWGASSTRAGNVWIDDVDIREIGLAHTVRRMSQPLQLPVKVTSKDGTLVYEEGKDYKVGIEMLTLPQQTTIKEGQELLVSWYQSAQTMMASTAASACYQDYFTTLLNNFKKTRELLGTDRTSKFFIYYDENRVFNWDPNCPTKPATAGDYLANNIRTYQDMLLKEYPGLELYIWHDMFDPNSNAIKKYWQVNGDLTNSWEGLRGSSTTVVNWTDSRNQNPVKSLTFFNKELHLNQIIAGYYDDKSVGLDEVKAWMDALDTAETQQGVTGVNGFMYTTFTSSYADLEKVTKYLKERPGSRWPK